MDKLAKYERDKMKYQDATKRGKLKWQKKRNPMTNLTPKKKKRK